MNIQALLKQAQKMQSDMTKLEKQLQERSYVEENDFVIVKCDGNYHIESIEFKQTDDMEMLQDMTAIAVSKVIEKAKTDHDSEMSKITGGVKMPGAF